MAIETEIEGYKKSISKAQEQNEKITLLHNKIEADISVVKKQIGISRTKTEALKTEYSTYTRALHDTEQKLSKAHTVLCIGKMIPISEQYCMAWGFHKILREVYTVSTLPALHLLNILL